MKKMIAVLGMAVSLVAMTGFAAQDSEVSIKEVRDPRQLKTWLEANASDAQTRLAAAESGAGVSALSAAKLTAGTAATAINGAAITNLTTPVTAALVAIKAAPGALTTNVFGVGSASTGTVVWATASGTLVSITIAP